MTQAYDAERARHLYEYLLGNERPPRPAPPEELVQLFMPSQGGLAAACGGGPALALGAFGGLALAGVTASLCTLVPLVVLAVAPGILALASRSLRRARVTEILTRTYVSGEWEVERIEGRAVTIRAQGNHALCYTDTVPPTWRLENGRWINPRNTVLDVGSSLCVLSVENFSSRFTTLWGAEEPRISVRP